MKNCITYISKQDKLWLKRTAKENSVTVFTLISLAIRRLQKEWNEARTDLAEQRTASELTALTQRIEELQKRKQELKSKLATSGSNSPGLLSENNKTASLSAGH